jgi:hypothetical protein
MIQGNTIVDSCPPVLRRRIATNEDCVTCRLWFVFKVDFMCCVSAAPSEGSIPMKAGDEFFILESDQGDGWTRVRRRANGEEGFVPTSLYPVSFKHIGLADF